MSEARLSQSLRVLHFVPVLASLAILAWTMDRGLLGAPLGLLLIAAWAFRWKLRARFVLATVVGGAGALIGVLQPSGAHSIGTTLPPIAAAAFACGAASIAVYLSMCDHWPGSWIASAVLAAVALDGSRSTLGAELFAVFVGALVFAPMLEGALRSRSGWSTVAGFVVLVAALVPMGLLLKVGVAATNARLLHLVDEWARDNDSGNGVALQTDIELLAASSVEQSMQPLFEVDGVVPGKLRTMALDRFNGVTWSTVAPHKREHLTLVEPPPSSWQRENRLFLNEPLFGAVPAPAGTYRVLGATVQLEKGWIWRMLGTPQQPLTIDRSAVDVLPQEPPPDASFTYLPGGMEKEFGDIAHDIVGNAKTARERATRIQNFFLANFEYSFKTDLRGGGRDPLLVLIKERRPAYCVYFAGAMAALLRSLGIPARIVTGFTPWERNRFTGRTVVRKRDAHAWVEAYLPEEGRFVAYDPTPSRTHDVIDPQPGFLGQLWEAITSQSRRGWLAFREDPVGWILAVARHPITWVLAILALLTEVLRRWREHRRSRRRGPLPPEDKTLAALYERYLRALQGKGIIPGAAETDDEILSRIAVQFGSETEAAVEPFVERYRRRRYGGASDPGELQSVLEKAEAAIRAAAHREAA